MQADGFLSRQERHPVALAAALGLNLAAVTALLLAKGEMIPLPPTVIRLIDIPPAVNEAPPPPRPQPRTANPMPAKTSPKPVIDQVDPIIPTGGETLVDPGSGPGPIIDEPRTVEPPAEPVLVDAAPDPRFAALFQPPYPPQLERLDIEGKVVVKVLVGADGRVRAVEIVYADDEGFAAVTERQARAKWRFRPATRNGVAVESWKQMTVRFQIRRG